MVNGYGGTDAFFDNFPQGMNAKPGDKTFLTELSDVYGITTCR